MSNEYRMPIGCAFTAKELFYDINSKKIKVSNKVKIKYTGNRPTYLEFAGNLFTKMVEIIVKDLVETGATFKLPMTGIAKAVLKVSRYGEKAFKNFRKAGLWKDLNFFESMFTGPLLTLYLQGKGIIKLKLVICDRDINKRMVEKCNEGFLYGDKVLDKNINDYYDIIFKTFPDVPEKTLKIILKYGWRSLFTNKIYGAEISFRNSTFSCYFGKLSRNRFKMINHYAAVLARKLRLVALRNKFPISDYCYFALPKVDYEQFLKTKMISRPIITYKLFEECLIAEHGKEYIFRTKIPELKGYSKFRKNGYKGEIDLILTREPLKFKDMSTLDNSYMILEYKENKKRHSRQNLNEFK